MRDTKSLSLLLLSSVLFLLSIILLCTWGYQYYHQIQEDKSNDQVAKKTSTVPDSTRDSLLKIYQVTMSSLNTRLDSATYYADSLKGSLDINLTEFYKLRDEIAVLLHAKTPNVEDLNLARKKINELQQRVEQLRYRNTDVEKENKRLKAILNQLSKESQSVGQNLKQVSGENRSLTNKVNSIVAVSTANINLSAVTDNDQNITNEAKQTEKLVGSFVIKNNGSAIAKYDIIVVVLQPDGQVLQKSAWESGSFETPNGRKIYSCKIRYDAEKGESKQLNFTLSADSYQKGKYTLQLYHNGVIIGSTVKNLS